MINPFQGWFYDINFLINVILVNTLLTEPYNPSCVPFGKELVWYKTLYTVITFLLNVGKKVGGGFSWKSL